MSDQSIRPDYESTTIRITDLATVHDVISHKTFSNCLIVGPAILTPMDGLTLSDCTFDAPSAQDMVIVVEPRLLLGVIGLDHCAFYSCRFTRIGFVATDTFLEKLTSQRPR